MRTACKRSSGGGKASHRCGLAALQGCGFQDGYRYQFLEALRQGMQRSAQERRRTLQEPPQDLQRLWVSVSVVSHATTYHLHDSQDARSPTGRTHLRPAAGTCGFLVNAWQHLLETPADPTRHHLRRREIPAFHAGTNRGSALVLASALFGQSPPVGTPVKPVAM
jgi:hypothetical protein